MMLGPSAGGTDARSHSRRTMKFAWCSASCSHLSVSRPPVAVRWCASMTASIARFDAGTRFLDSRTRPSGAMIIKNECRASCERSGLAG